MHPPLEVTPLRLKADARQVSLQAGPMLEVSKHHVRYSR